MRRLAALLFLSLALVVAACSFEQGGPLNVTAEVRAS